MPPITVRPYCETDREAFGLVRSLTYRGGEPVGPEEELLRPDCFGYVAESEDKVVGAFTAIDFRSVFWSSELRCAGVCAVAVNPEVRKSGVGSGLMRQGLRLMKEQGFSLATLYAFRETYYRKFGYEVVGRRMRLKVPEHRMPHVGSQLEVRQLVGDAWREIVPCYNAFARRYNGCNIRRDEQWWRVLGGDTPLAVFAAGDPVQSYVLVRLDGGFWKEHEIKEVVASSGEGYRAILSFLSGIGINKTHLSWLEPGDSPFLASYHDQGVEATVERPLMARILDVRGALALLEPVGAGAINLAVQDEDLPENQGPWRIEFKDGKVQVEPAAKADITCDVRSLTQMLVGDPSFEELHAQGRIEGESGPAAQLFRAHRVYCADAF